MKKNLRSLIGVMLVIGGMAMAQEKSVMKAKDLLKLPTPTADKRISYGPLPLQFGDLRIPKGHGPFPMVIVVHGGCWLSAYDLTHLASFCDALTQAGVATWCIEYRRLGDEGGGWPGTFTDVGIAADFVRSLKASYPIDLTRVMVVGHSAGGHLALWLAGRSGIAAKDALWSADPIRLRGVVSLAGITDLARGAEEKVCDDAISRLLGGTASLFANRLRSTSPIAMLPLGVPQVLVIGNRDSVVPEIQATAYCRMAQAKGDSVKIIRIEESGHYELVTPGSVAWPMVRATILAMLKPSLG